MNFQRAANAFKEGFAKGPELHQRDIDLHKVRAKIDAMEIHPPFWLTWKGAIVTICLFFLASTATVQLISASLESSRRAGLLWDAGSKFTGLSVCLYLWWFSSRRRKLKEKLYEERRAAALAKRAQEASQSEGARLKSDN